MRRAAVWLATVVPLGLASALLSGCWRLGAVVALAVALLWLHRRMVEPGAVPVLTYHSVSARPDWLPWSDGLSVSPRAFERHLSMLSGMGFEVIPTERLIAARREGESLPGKAVVIHLDDGYLDNWVAAYPLLRHCGATATVFVSADFIAAGDTTRPRLDTATESDGLMWEGHLNCAELVGMDRSEVIRVEAHGTDHGRVPTGPRAVDRLRPGNWRRHAWLQWRQMPGSKARWHEHHEPPAVGFGAAVPESGSALVARAWDAAGRESQEAFEQRVLDSLERSRRELGAILERDVTILCWPFNEWSDTALDLARQAGFVATTAGEGENRPGEDWRRISRVHAGDSALGFHWRLADDFVFRATVRFASGNYYWYVAALPAFALRKCVLSLRRRFRRSSGVED